jgi:hypothetical protein
LATSIKVFRLSPTTDEFRVWGSGKVEVHATPDRVAIEFTRKAGRGTSTFQIVFDGENVRELGDKVTLTRDGFSK